MGEVIPVASLRPIRTACKTLGGRTFEHPSCGGFMPTAETTLLPALGNQRAAKRSLTSDARLDNAPLPRWLAGWRWSFTPCGVRHTIQSNSRRRHAIVEQ